MRRWSPARSAPTTTSSSSRCTETSIELEDLVWALDEPLADLSALGFMALSELAAQHVTVALAGQGADELFGGYSRHARRAGRSRPDRSTLRRATGRRSRHQQARADTHASRRAFAADDPADRYLALRTPFREPRAPTPDRARPAARRRRTRTRARRRRMPPTPTGAHSLRHCSSTAQLGLVDDMLHYSDRVSMAHSLEVRVPFLDHEVVELAATIPRL